MLPTANKRLPRRALLISFLNIPRPGEARIQQFIAEATQSLITGAASPERAMAVIAAKAQDTLGPDLVETM
jgi:hypothetical protein